MCFGGADLFLKKNHYSGPLFYLKACSNCLAERKKVVSGRAYLASQSATLHLRPRLQILLGEKGAGAGAMKAMGLRIAPQNVS